jgi:hypothetical protein
MIGTVQVPTWSEAEGMEQAFGQGRRTKRAKRLRAKLRELKATLMPCRHLPAPRQGHWLRSVSARGGGRKGGPYRDLLKIRT